MFAYQNTIQIAKAGCKEFPGRCAKLAELYRHFFFVIVSSDAKSFHPSLTGFYLLSSVEYTKISRALLTTMVSNLFQASTFITYFKIKRRFQLFRKPWSNIIRVGLMSLLNVRVFMCVILKMQQQRMSRLSVGSFCMFRRFHNHFHN